MQKTTIALIAVSIALAGTVGFSIAREVYDDPEVVTQDVIDAAEGDTVTDVLYLNGYIVGGWVEFDGGPREPRDQHCATDTGVGFGPSDADGNGLYATFHDEGNWFMENDHLYISIDKRLDEETGNYEAIRPIESSEFIVKVIDQDVMELRPVEGGESFQMIRCPESNMVG